MLKAELAPTLNNVSQKTEEEGAFSNSFGKPIIILIPNQTKAVQKRENCAPTSLMNINTEITNKIQIELSNK